MGRQVADIGGDVDADGTRRGLGHGNHVADVGAGHPARISAELVNKGQGGQTTADGKKADFDKGSGQL